MAPSIESHDQSIPFILSYRRSPCFQNSTNTSASVHSMKRRCAEECLQMVVLSNACHWHPVRKTNRIPFIASRSEIRGLWHPKGCFFGGGSNGSICSHNLSGILQSSSFVINPMGFHLYYIPPNCQKEELVFIPNGIGSKSNSFRSAREVPLSSVI